MIQLLFTLIFPQMVLILLLIIKNPLRKLSIMCLDRVKRGRGPIVIKTVVGTVFVALASSLYSIVKIRRRGVEESGGGDAVVISPTDQVLMVKHLLEATLMGSSLFLALMIDRIHQYIRELHIRRKSMEAIKKKALAAEENKLGEQTRSFEDAKVEENKALAAEVTALQAKLKQLESELDAKTKEVHASEVNAVALQKQSEGFLLEYDRLLKENQSLRSQLQSLDSRFLSRSSTKKNI